MLGWEAEDFGHVNSPAEKQLTRHLFGLFHLVTCVTMNKRWNVYIHAPLQGEVFNKDVRGGLRGSKFSFTGTVYS